MAKTHTTDINDLWADAALQLHENDRAQLNFNRPDKLKILTELHELTLDAKEQCIQKRWRYKRKSGEEVIFTDVFNKIVKWIDVFKQVGDTAVQYDPVHAALPWAGIRFLLQMAIGDVDKFGFAIESIENIAAMLPRYALLEAIHLSNESTLTEQLEKSLVRLYATILLFLSKSRHYFEQNSALRRLRSGVLPKTDLESCFATINTACIEVDRCSFMLSTEAQSAQHVALFSLLQSLQEPVRRTNEALRDIKDDLEVSKRTEILQWISSEQYLRHHVQTSRNILKGTGQWLLQHEIYKNWRYESVSSILWLHGIPGSGKSKLVALVIKDFRNNFGKGHCPMPAFFYCTRSQAEPARSDPDAILASLARQLSSIKPGDPLLPPTVDLYKQRENEGFASGPPSPEDSRQLILDLIEHHPTATIIIDALDECNPETRDELLEALQDILQKSTSLVKIFLSSRDDQDLVLCLNGYPNLTISSNLNSGDISAFVEAETENLVRRRKLLVRSSRQSTLKELIVRTINKRAAGMFRWASLLLQNLCSAASDDAIYELLETIPESLEALYHTSWTRMSTRASKADLELIRRTLATILSAQTQLNSADFVEFVSTSSDYTYANVTSDQLLDLCSDLVVLNQDLDVFRVAHLSVREFLERLPEFGLTFTNAILAELCLLTVAHSCDSQNPVLPPEEAADASVSQITSVCRYAAIYWPFHTQLAGDCRSTGKLLQLLCKFLVDSAVTSSTLPTWRSRLNTLLDQGQGDVAANLRDKLRDILKTSEVVIMIILCFDIHEHPFFTMRTVKKAITEESLDAWAYAIKYRSARVFSNLLQDAATPLSTNILAKFAECYVFPNEMAAMMFRYRGQELTITEDVLRSVAKSRTTEMMITLVSQYDASAQITERVLLSAADNYYCADEMLCYLARCAPPTTITKEILLSATRNGLSNEILWNAVLLPAWSNFGVNEQFLELAAEHLNAAIFVTVFRHCTQGNSIDYSIKSLLTASVVNRDASDIIGFLLSDGGEKLTLDEELLVALVAQVDVGTLQIIWQQQSIPLHITDRVLQTAMYASTKSRKKLFRWLLQRSRQLLRPDFEILFSLCVDGQCEILEMLFDKGADPRCLDEKGSPLLSWVCRMSVHERFAIVESLLGRGADPMKASHSGWLPIHYAVFDGDVNMVKVLLKHWREIKTIARDIPELSLRMLTRGQVAYVKSYLGSVVRQRGRFLGATALHVAIIENRAELVKLLLDFGSNPNSRNGAGRTPVYEASSRGHIAVLGILLEKQGVLDVTDHSDHRAWSWKKGDSNLKHINAEPRTPLHIAARHGHIEAVKLLLAHGYVNGVSDKCHSPIYHAVRNEHVLVVELLIQHGSPIDEVFDDLGPGGDCPDDISATKCCKCHTHVESRYDSNLDERRVKQRTLLHLACSNGNIEIVGLLLVYGATICAEDSYGETALHIASFGGYHEIVDLLLRKGAVTDAKNLEGHTALATATVRGCMAVVSTLMERGASPQYLDSAKRSLMMHLALEHGEVAIARCLVEEHGVSLDAEGAADWLLTAIQGGSCLSLQYLLDYGLDPNVQDHNGSSMLHYGTEDASMTELLCNRGALVSAIDEASATPLHLAAKFGCAQSISILLDNGADIHATDNSGCTPLEYAIMSAEPQNSMPPMDVIRLLYFKGARVKDIDRQLVHDYLEHLLLEQSSSDAGYTESKKSAEVDPKLLYDIILHKTILGIQIDEKY